MRKPALILFSVMLLLFVAACSEDNGDDAVPTTAPTTEDATTEPTEDAVETAEPTEDGNSASAGNLFGSFNPFSALQGLSGAAPSSTDVDPSLKEALLAAEDLPSGFLSFGEFTFSVPDPEVGTIDMAARTFMSGDVASGELGAMVMSMAASMPPGSQDAFGDLDELADLSQEELDEISARAGQFGIEFGDIRVLDASGLGESGGAMHMEMDFGGLLDSLGAAGGENPFADGIAMDMYMFVRGERMLMLMIMYPAGGDAGIDGHDLAEMMDGRAS